MQILNETNISEENIKYVLNLPYVDGITYNYFSLNNPNEMVFLLGLSKTYNLLKTF